MFSEAELIKLGKAEPGIFIEECTPSESLQDLTREEILDYAAPVWEDVFWHGIGHEVAPEYDWGNVKADVRDMDILDWNKWALGAPPTPENRKHLPL